MKNLKVELIDEYFKKINELEFDLENKQEKTPTSTQVFQYP